MTASVEIYTIIAIEFLNNLLFSASGSSFGISSNLIEAAFHLASIENLDRKSNTIAAHHRQYDLAFSAPSTHRRIAALLESRRSEAAERMSNTELIPESK